VPLLETLNFGRNEITHVEPGTFHGIAELRSLNLSHNRLDASGLADGGLYGLHTLRHLDLSHNSFTRIHGSLWSYVRNLEWLSLASNHIRHLPLSAFSLPSLKFLSIAQNRIDEVHKYAFSGLDTLRELDVSANNLAMCVEDRSILQNSSLPHLRILRFTSNKLRIIPSRAFQNFPNLKVLDLNDNPISTIFADAFYPLSLHELYEYLISSITPNIRVHIEVFQKDKFIFPFLRL
jgi:Leucine-rich repeat (LRR) protein